MQVRRDGGLVAFRNQRVVHHGAGQHAGGYRTGHRPHRRGVVAGGVDAGNAGHPGVIHPEVAAFNQAPEQRTTSNEQPVC